MPPVLIWVAGAIGVFAAAKWIAREARRINAELHPEGGAPPGGAEAKPVKLQRDASGVYRPE